MTITALPLADAVREATRTDHDFSEQTGLMSELVSDRVTAEHHRTLLEQLWFVYQALEEGAAALRAQHSDTAQLLDPRLDRRQALADDLAALIGPDWREQIQANPATLRYAAAISAAVDQGDTPTYLAHHYTRYLGDLSGGLFIGRNVERHTGLGQDGGPGASFYRFDQITKPRAFKDHYRELLNQLDWDEQQRDRFIAAARQAYTCNNELFDDIDHAEASRG